MNQFLNVAVGAAKGIKGESIASILGINPTPSTDSKSTVAKQSEEGSYKNPEKASKDTTVYKTQKTDKAASNTAK